MKNKSQLGRIKNPNLMKRYKMEKIIGKGGQGYVFKGYDKIKEMDVAVKVFKPTDEDGDPEKLKEGLARFQREIEITRALQHPHIVNVYDVDFYPDNSYSSYISMEYVVGGPLIYYIKQEKLDLLQNLSILRDVSSAIGYAHNYENQVLHRDIKPGNILLGANEDGTFTPKVTDFGMSRRALDFDVTAINKMPGGTHCYMAIDYIVPKEGKPGVYDICPQTDIYALGITMYYMFAKNLPLKTDGMQQYFAKLCNPNYSHPPLAEAVSDVPQDVSEVCMQAIAIHKKNRYPTMKAFRSDLVRLIEKYSGDFKEEVFEEDEMTATIHDVDVNELMKQIQSFNQGSKILVGKSIHEFPAQENSAYTITNKNQLLFVNEKGLSITNLINKQKEVEIPYSFKDEHIVNVTYIPQQTKPPYYVVATYYGNVNDNTRIYFFQQNKNKPLKTLYFASDLVPEMCHTPSFFCHGSQLALPNNSKLLLKDLATNTQNGYPLKDITLCTPQKDGIIVGKHSTKKNKPCIGFFMFAHKKKPIKLGSVIGDFDTIGYNAHANILYTATEHQINAYELATASNEQRKYTDTSCIQHDKTLLEYKPQNIYSTIQNVVLQDNNTFKIYTDNKENPGELTYVGDLVDGIDDQFVSLTTFPYNNFLAINKQNSTFIYKL